MAAELEVTIEIDDNSLSKREKLIATAVVRDRIETHLPNTSQMSSPRLGFGTSTYTHLGMDADEFIGKLKREFSHTCFSYASIEKVPAMGHAVFTGDTVQGVKVKYQMPPFPEA